MIDAQPVTPIPQPPPPRLRVCLASIHPRMLSGQIEALVALHTRLEGLGHSVQLVSAFPPADLEDPRRWTSDRGDGLVLAPKVLRISWIVQAIVAAARTCDVVHFNLPTPAFAVLADVVQALTRRPVVVGYEAHLADVPSVATRLLQAPEFYAPRIIVNNGLVARISLRRGLRYVVSSQFQRRELLALGYDAARIRVIPNLIDDRKMGRWAKEEARAALGLPGTLRRQLVVFVGHYHDVKGHDVLIEAFRLLRTDFPNAALVLAWSGIGNQKRVRAAIARAGIGGSVIELGRVDVSQLFAAADAVALPYRFSIGQAAYPGTVLEAMWAGAPLVTSDLPLLAELAEGGRTALLARPNDPKDLGEKIATLLAHPDRAAALVDAQRAAMAERFNPDRLTREYVQVYREAMGAKEIGCSSPIAME